MAESYPGYQAGAGAPKPNNNIVWAIVSLAMGVLCSGLCGIPFGIASLVFSLQVDNKWNMGDFAGAEESARKAKLWGMIGVIVSAVLLVVLTIMYVVLIAAATTVPDFTTTTIR
ncbi:MAG: CD225/dispanin family protein [Actinobacteria bacterium]|nr:CD225/dispanin family protein [Actinomycetota bacterium]